MDLQYGKGLLILLLFILLELLYSRLIKKEEIPWDELASNLNSGHLLLLIFRGATVIVYSFIFQKWGWAYFVELPELIQWIIALVLWDFGFYWAHRLHHEIPFLWNIHHVHHQAEHFNLSLGFRHSWFHTLSSAPFMLPLAFVGIPTELFLAVAGINLFVQFYNHNKVVRNSGWLEKVFITPELHRVHHGCNPEYVDKNHGGTFVFWDRMFGTYKQKDPKVDIIYGTHDKINPHNPIWVNVRPLLAYLGLNAFGKREKMNYKFPGIYIGLGTFLLLGFLIYYIAVQASWSFPMLFGLFAWVFMGTVAMGAMSDGNGIASLFWGFLSLSFGSMFILFWEVREVYGVVLFSLAILHAACGIPLYFQAKKSRPVPNSMESVTGLHDSII